MMRYSTVIDPPDDPVFLIPRPARSNEPSEQRRNRLVENNSLIQYLIIYFFDSTTYIICLDR